MMFKQVIFISLAVLIAVYSTFAAELSRNTDNEDIRQIGLILDRIERGIQQQRPEWILSTMTFDSTKSTLNRESAMEETRQNFELFKTSVENRQLRSELPHLKNSGDFNLTLKKLVISEDKQYAVAEIEVGFAFSGDDSTYFLSLDPSAKTAITSNEKEHLLKYQPVKLELLKKHYNWRVLKIDGLTDFLRAKTNYFNSFYEKEKGKVATER